MTASVIAQHVSFARNQRWPVQSICHPSRIPEVRRQWLCWVPHSTGANSGQRAYTQRPMRRQFSPSQSVSSNGALQQCAQEATCEDARALAQRWAD